MLRRIVPCLAVLTVSIFTAHAQTSAAFHVTEYSLDGGGNPRQGQRLASATYRVSLDEIGEGVVATGLSGSTYHATSGFGAGYPPPGEVAGLAFAKDRVTLSWRAERSAGSYSVYRGPVDKLPSGNTGTCLASWLPVTTLADAAVPPRATAFLYLVTARNRLGEEGTKGPDSNGAPRPNPQPCP